MNLIIDSTLGSFTFRVDGVPAPGGSKRAFPHRTTGRMMVVDAGGKKTKEWREKVAAAGTAAMNIEQLGIIESDIVATFRFAMPRPKSHFNTQGEIKERFKDAQHIVRPDTTKLVRSTEDALTGIIWKDDAQITHQTASKFYADNDSKVCAIITIDFDPPLEG